MHPLTALANLLYPPTCVLCQATLRGLGSAATGLQARLCAGCLTRMPRCGPPACARCGAELPGAFDATPVCARCRRMPPAFDAAVAPWRYEAATQAAVRQFKYRQRHYLGDWFAETMAQAASSRAALAEADLIVPVPPYWLTRRLRGFDAPGHLARRLARQLGKPCAPAALRRTRWTVTQTRLSWAKRRRNVRGAFTARPSLVRHQTVLLVDDVLTSGATAEACACALRAAGASRVVVLTAARTALRAP